MNSTNNVSARQSVERSREMFYYALREKFPEGQPGDIKCWEWVNGLVLTQGFIRLEVQLNATNNIYTFGVTPNQANSSNVVFNTEQRLPLQDSLCATEMFVYVMRPLDSTGAASQTGTNALKRTYGNTIDFATGAQALDATFYSHGIFKCTVNNRVIVPQRALSDFWYKGETQQTAALGVGSPGDEIRGAEDGGATCEPNIVFIGSANTVPQIVLPSNLAAVDTFSRVILEFRGPYAQNSTVVN